MPSSPVPLATLLQAVPAGVGTAAPEAAIPGAWAPLLLLGLPVAVALLLVVLYVRTARLHRRALMAPPVWLLPYLEQQGEAPGSGPAALPAPDADHVALEEIRVESTARLARRKRVLLAGLALNFVAGWAGAAVYLYSANRQVEFQELPTLAGSRLEDVVDTAAFRGLEDRPEEDAPVTGAAPTVEAVDTAALRLRRERLALLADRRRDSLAEVARLDSIALAEQIARRVRDSIAQAVQDSLARAAAVVPPPPPPPPSRPAEPDPALLRDRAIATLRGSAEALTAAIAGRQGLGALLGSGPAPSRFVRFVEESRPTARLEGVEAPVLSGSTATAVALVRLEWRGGFGQARSEVGRFRLEAEREGEGWRVLRAVPLSELP